jgi:hypothetical protein
MCFVFLVIVEIVLSKGTYIELIEERTLNKNNMVFGLGELKNNSRAYRKNIHRSTCQFCFMK